MYFVGICVEMYAQTRLYKPGKWHNIRTKINLIYIPREIYAQIYVYIYTLHKLVVCIYIFIHIFSYGYECTYLFIYIYKHIYE